MTHDEPTRLGRISVRQIDSDVGMPARAYSDDAGLDLKCRDRIELRPGQRVLARTGIAIGLPRGYVGWVVPRSGLALEDGITVFNSPGVVDAGYTGEIGVVLINHDLANTRIIERGERVAQLVIMRCELPDPVRVRSLQRSTRGRGGFGHTGS